MTEAQEVIGQATLPPCEHCGAGENEACKPDCQVAQAQAAVDAAYYPPVAPSTPAELALYRVLSTLPYGSTQGDVPAPPDLRERCGADPIDRDGWMDQIVEWLRGWSAYVNAERVKWERAHQRALAYEMQHNALRSFFTDLMRPM